MSNRAQRRAAKRQGLKPGQTYGDVLAQKKMIRQAVERTARDTSIGIEADIKTQRFLWMAVIALNEAFGFGGERSKRFLLALNDVAEECEAMAKAHGGMYAKAKLMERAGQITGIPAEPVHEEEMIRARKENEAQGVYFPADDPDKW